MLILPSVWSPTATGEGATTYSSAWYGSSFEEIVDPLGRYEAFPVQDVDGDGFAELSPAPLPPMYDPSEGRVVMTDSAIQMQMAVRGISREVLATQVAVMLSNNPPWREEGEAILRHIEAGRYLEAASTAAGTPLEVGFYCGGSIYSWIIGVPIVISCPSGPVIAVAEILYIKFHPLGTINPSDITLAVVFDGRPQLPGAPTTIGVGYAGHWAGLYGSMDRIWWLNVEMHGVGSYTSTIRATLRSIWGPYFSPGESIWYTLAGTPTQGPTIWLNIGSEFVIYWVNVVFSASPWGFDADITLEDATVVASLQANFREPDTSRQVTIVAKKLPSRFKIGMQQVVEFAWGRYDITLEHPDGYALHDLEIKGSYYVSTDAMFSFSFVGFPASTQLRITPGRESSASCGADTDNVFSIDLTKGSPGVEGRFRTISAQGHYCLYDINVMASNVHRARFATGKHDLSDPDRDAFVMHAAGLDVAEECRCTDIWFLIDADDSSSFWLKDYKSHFRYLKLSGFPPVGQFNFKDGTLIRDLFFGESYKADILGFNGYWWAVAQDELDIDSCILRYPGTSSCL